MSFNFGKYLRRSGDQLNAHQAQAIAVEKSSQLGQVPNDDSCKTANRSSVNLTFYRSYYSDLAEFSDIQLEAHWERQGSAEGRHANPEELFQSLLNDERVPSDFDIDSYVRMNPDLNETFDHPFEILDHFINTGIMERRQYRPNEMKPSVFFDVAFYQDIYQDLSAKSEEELFIHWNSQGREEGRFGSAQHALMMLLKDNRLPSDFSVEAYVELNPDIAESIRHSYQAVEHYLQSGMNEKRAYLPDHLMVDFSELPPEFLSECEILDFDFYKNFYTDLNELTVNQLEKHWYFQGKDEGRFSSAAHAMEVTLANAPLPSEFNVKEYLQQNPSLQDVIKYDFEAVRHYLGYGIHDKEDGQGIEFLSECERLDCQFYKDIYTDLDGLDEDQLKNHWYFQGRDEGRFCSPSYAVEVMLDNNTLPDDFDVADYLRYNSDLQDTLKYEFQAIHHYLEFGIDENRTYLQANRENSQVSIDKFDANFYRAFYSDLKDETDDSCVTHYVNTGHLEGRKANLDDYIKDLSDGEEFPAQFNLPTYIRKNADLIGHFDNKWEYFKHYLQTGRTERRSYIADKIDRKFVQGFYGLELSKKLTPSEGLNKIRAQLQLDLSDPVFLNEQELANFYGFKFVEFLALFDHEAYIFSNGEGQSKLMSMPRSRCLEHFLVEGYKTCPNINYEHRFDPSFYGNEYRDSLMHLVRDDDHDSEDVWVLPAVTQRIYEHWVRYGIHEGKLANLSRFVYKIYDVKLPEKVQEEVAYYRTLTPSSGTLVKPSHTFQSFVSHGIEERKFSETHNAETCEFYCSLANKFAIDGKTHVAVRLYEEILTVVPNFPMALHHLGDELLKSKFYRKAIECYDRLILNGTATEWTYLNLCECYKHLGLYSEAASMLKHAKRVYPADVFLNQLSAEMLDDQLLLALDKSRHLVKLNRVDEGGQVLRDALAVFDINRTDELVSRDSGKIAIVGNHDLPQCRFYRIDQKYDLLVEAGYTVDVYKHTEDLADFHSRLCAYEAVIFYRVPAIPGVIKAINATNIEGIPSIYDVDDLIFDVDYFPPSFESYAGQISRDVHGQLTVDTNLIEHAIRMCEYGIASTTSLAEHMKKYVRSGQVGVLFNGLGLTHNRNISLSESEPKRKDDGSPVTIFYGSGTKAHKDDFHSIVEPVFCRLHEKYGENIRFLVMGHIGMTDKLKSLGNSITLLEPVTDIESYWEILREEADINLAVLSSTEVTDTKSEIKWLEAGMFGIPSVVSSTATYREVVSHESTGFVCEGSDDFYASLEFLIDKPEARKLIGANAKAEILNSYNTQIQSTKLRDVIQRFKSNAKQGKMRVAIVNVFYPPEAIGGATRVVHDNVLELKHQFGEDIEIQVFCTTAGVTPYAMRQYEMDGVKVTAVACPSMPEIDHNMSDQHMGFAFNRFLKDFTPDLVHFHCIQRLTESIVSETRRLDIPYVITAHDGWWVSDRQFLVDADGGIELYSYDSDLSVSSLLENDRAKKLSRELLGAEKILAVSEPFAHIYKSAGLEHVITIENGVSGLTRTDRVRSGSGKIRLAHIGGMERHKGLHILKNVLVSTPSIDNVELLVIDHGAPYGAIRKEMWGSTEVTFRAKTLQSEVANLYSNIDILIAPSVWPESFGLVTREALHCGCWVVASDRGCIGESITEGENGFVVSVDRINELKNCLLEINAKPGRYLESPIATPELRSSREQAKDLFALYCEITQQSIQASIDGDRSNEQRDAA